MLDNSCEQLYSLVDTELIFEIVSSSMDSGHRRFLAKLLWLPCAFFLNSTLVAQTRDSRDASTRSSANTDPIDAHNEKGDYLLYVGTYTVRGSRGIYAFRFNSQTGQLSSLGLMIEGVNPSYLAFNSKTSVLYAVSEVTDYKGKDTGAIQSYRIEPQTGKLTLLNQVSSQGGGPCVISVDAVNGYLWVANFHGGNVAVFRLMEDGRIGEATGVIQHHGSGANPTRQNKPHPHDIALDHNRKMAVVADLGMDKLMLYGFDPSTGSMTPFHPPSVAVHDSAGPRHFVFSNDGRFLYVINEIDSTISVFSVTHSGATFKGLQTISTLPKDFNGHNDAAELGLSADGKVLYASNRGADSITAFSVDQQKGTLQQTGTYPSHGRTPATFQFAPGGQFLLVANQGSDEIRVLRIDQKSGALTDAGQHAAIAAPSSFVFVPQSK